MSTADTVRESLFPAPELAFPREEYRDRLARVRKALERHRIDCLFVSAPEGMCWLSGYEAAFLQGQNPKAWPPTSGVAVHVDHDRLILFDTAREAILHRVCTVAEDIRIFPPGPDRDGTAFIAAELAAEGWLGGTVGLEHWSYRPNRAISERFEAHLAGHGARVVDGSDVLREERWHKSPREMAAIEHAARIGCEGLRAAREAIRPGVMEVEVLGAALAAMSSAGGEVPSVIPPVLSGPKTASPHGLAGQRRIGSGEVVVVDLAGVYQRYHANLARTFWVGDPPADVASLAERAAGSFGRLAATVRPGLAASDLAAALIDYYESAGIWPERSWLGGYEMSLSFPPAWTGNYVFDVASGLGHERRFEAGNAINFEHQFYLPRLQGLYFSIDTVVFDVETARLLSTEIPHGLQVV